MSVQSEEFSPRDAVMAVACICSGIRRRRDGTWMFDLTLNVNAAVPDGRRMKLNKTLSLSADEWTGRKPAEPAGA